MAGAKLYRFRVFDSIVSSQIDLPELSASPASAEAEPDFCLHVAPVQVIEKSYDWLHHWYQDDARQIIDSSLARERDGYRLRFQGQSDFLILDDGRKIVCEPLKEVPLETIRHLFLDHVLPRIVGQRGELVLHASAVELPNGCGIAFIGKSGWGKSTLASSLRDAGARFLGDDCLHLKVSGGDLMGIPAYAGTRLWEDSRDALFPEGIASEPVSHYNSKHRINFRDSEKTVPTTFRALFFLDDPNMATDGPAAIHPINGSAAVVELIKRSFLLDVRNLDSAAGQFAAVGKLLATSPLFYSLQYPREYSRLSEVRQAIFRTLGMSEFGLGEKQASSQQ